jgi:hypothetical protein
MISVLSCAAVLAAALPTAAQQARGRGTTGPFQVSMGEPIPNLRGFGVVLVQGEMQTGTADGQTVPAAALKALNDLKDFLPYKNYKLLDTQWTMGGGRMSGTLRGPENSSYTFEVQARKGTDAPIVISRFMLGGPAEDRMAGLVARGMATSNQANEFYVKASPFTRSLIDTSFSMDIGETVVVGTSRLQGNNALIVLLTAVSKSVAAR